MHGTSYEKPGIFVCNFFNTASHNFIMDIDNVFAKIGDFGSSQKKIFYILTVCQIFLGFHMLILTFIGAEPDWTCGGKNMVLRCAALEKEECSPTYIDDFTSIVSEWELVCSKESWPKMSQSVYFVGSLIGAWLWGTVADKIGRKKVFFITITCTILSGVGYGLSPSYTVFVLFRLANAISCAGVILSSYVLSMEIVGMSARSFAGIAGAGFFSLSYPLLALLAYFIRSWRWLTVVVSLLGICYYPLWRHIPESPRWLLVSGNDQEALNVLASIAQGNGTTMPASCELKKTSDSSGGREVASICDLFTGKNIRHRTLVLCLVWFVNCMVYYVLAMSAGELGSNKYISFSLSGLVEIPSLIIGYLIVDRVGRRWTHGGFLIVGGCSCLAWTLFLWLNTAESLQVAVALIGKFAVASSFGFVYLYTAELFPTQVRNLGVGVTSIGARLGGILSPMVLLLASYSEGLPMIIMGGVATGAGLLSLTLPETLNQPMPETLADLD